MWPRVRDITGSDGIDHVVDADFGGNLAATIRCVCAKGSIAISASNSDRTPRLPVGDHAGSDVAARHAARKRIQSDIARWIASGRRILSVAEKLPLYQAAAHEAVKRGDKVGTVVVEYA